MTDKPVTPEMVAVADQRMTHANLFLDKLIATHIMLTDGRDPTIVAMELAVFLDMCIENKAAMADACAAAVARLAAK